jgi:hypothetical protein
MTRLVYGLVALPVALHVGTSWLVHRTRTPWWPVAIGGALFALILAPIWAPMILPGTGNVGLGYGGTFEVHAWNPLNALRNTFEGADGVRQYRFPNWFFYGSVFGREFFFTPLLAPFLLVGAWQAITQLHKLDAALILGWPLILLIFFLGDEYQNARFALAALPPMALLVALGVQTVQTRLTSRWQRPLHTWFTIGMIAMVVGGFFHIGRIINRNNEDVATVRWALEHIPSGAQVLTFGLTQPLAFESKLDVFDLYAMSPSQLDTLIDHRNTYALLDLQNLVTQWKDHAPGNNYRWLNNRYHLASLGELHNYTLFHVEASQ